MAKKEPLELPYEDDELLMLMQRLAKRLFVIVPDDQFKCKRIFFSQEDADRWFAARDAQEMTEEIAALEFANIDGNGTIPGNEPYELRVNINNPQAYAMKGSKGNAVFFTFATVDKATQMATGEPVDVYFTITNANGTYQKPKVYTYKEGEIYSFILDEYLTTGINTVTLMVRGRTTGLSRSISMTYELLNFTLETTFDISKALAKMNDALSVTYSCAGDYPRTVHFAIDGKEVASESISALETNPTKVKMFANFGNTYGAGTHTLQIKASMSLNDNVYWTNLLYREFEVAGEDHTTTLVSADFPASQDFFNGRVPGFTAKQFETAVLVWAFYSSSVNTASVLWRLFAEDGTETTIGSRQADVVEGETDVMPEPVRYMPTEAGVFKLQALVNGEVIKEYDLAVEPNEEITMATDGLMSRLTGIGRSNQEEPEFRSDWSCNRNGVKTWCEFSEGFPFTAAAGYNNDGVEFYNGHTGIIRGYKPLAPQNASVSKNGFAFGIRFRAYNMDDDNALIAHIGDPDAGTAGIFIYPNRAILRSSAGKARDREIRFKDEEDISLYWIVYPNANADMALFAFMQINGVRCFPRIYDSAENYNVGNADDESDYGLLHLGDPNGKCGIRVYSLMMYNIYQSDRAIQNNHIIDSGDIATQIERNNIYQTGSNDPDIQLLEERMPLIKLTGDLTSMMGSEGKPTLSGVGFELTHPDYYDHYAKCDLAELKKSGQSTQDRIGPMSMHIKFNKNKSNRLLDRNGKQYGKNRFPILPGYTPENSLRVLNNTLDSSNCNTGAILTFMNEVAQNVQIDGKYPLRTPQQEYVLSGQYEAYMKAKYQKQFPNKTDWSFPYKLNFCPVAYAGAIVWRKDDNSPYQWLGCYTFIEEKKTDDANGASSIRDKICEDGTLDPFDQYSGTKGEALVDNTGYLRFEIVTKDTFSMLQKGGELDWDTAITRREACLEKISEHKDETPDQTAQDWREYGNEVVKRLCPTEGNQEAFDRVIWDVFDIYSVVFHYIFMLIVCNTDGSFRNINQVRYQTGMKWRLVPWDWDMILGLLQDTYMLDAPMAADLYAKVNGNYIFNGMGYREWGKTGQDSYWFWDGILRNEEFLRMVPRMHAAMYQAGLKKKDIIAAFDNFVSRFSPAVFNIDAQGKYINPKFQYNKDYLVSDMGDRIAFRHLFLDTNMDYFEQIDGCGDFANTRTSTRAGGADHANVYIKAGATAVFGWTISGEEAQDGSGRTPKIAAGEEYTMTVDRILTTKDILGILSPHKLEVLDMHEFARFFSAELQFDSCYNETTGTSYMKRLIIGMTNEDITRYGANLSTVASISGISKMARLEELSIRGLYHLQTNPDISGCKNLRRYLAAASGLTAFNPADGAVFTEVELPDGLTSIRATDVTLPADGIQFLALVSDGSPVATTLTPVSCPTSLKVLTLTGMGDDPGTHKLLHAWLMMLKANPDVLSQAQLTCRNIYWPKATKEDVMMLSRITMYRSVTGYIMATDSEYTEDEMKQLSAESAFGAKCFSRGNESQTLVCDCMSTRGMRMSATAAKGTPDANVTITDENIQVLQGSDIVLTAVGFPLAGNVSYTYQVYVNNRWSNVIAERPVVNFGSRQQHSLNAYTGEIFIDETEEPTTDFRIRANRSDGATGEIVLRSIARTYPTKAQLSLALADFEVSYLNGVYNITEPGHYIFNADHTPAGYNGRFDTSTEDGWWEVVGVDDSVVARCTTDYLSGRTKWDEFCLQVKRLPEGETPLTLKYHSKWKNVSITATKAEAKIMLVSIVSQVLTRGGNQFLFDAFDGTFPHTDGDFSYSSLDLKTVEGSVSIAALLRAKDIDPQEFVTFMSNGRNVLDYLVNVSALDVSGTGINDISGDPIDASKLTQLRSLNAQGTYASIIF